MPHTFCCDSIMSCYFALHFLYMISTFTSQVHCGQTGDSHPNGGLLARQTSSNESLVAMTTTATDPLVNVKFTTTASASGIARAAKCWSEIMTWRNESAIWYDAHILHRTWTIGPVTTSQTFPWYSSTTVYPSGVSTYKLCDGSPRVNVQPSTSHWSGNSTTIFTQQMPMTPTFRTQPCTPDPEVCRLWYYDSDIKLKDDTELLNQCGNPAHQGAPCLIGGGPVRLVYFPVTTVGGNLCNKTGSTISITGNAAQPDIVTTLGHTFTSGSVYLSFQTLYASYDGFWDRIGPTFSNFILPLPSSAISTQCGGWASAHGPGTPLNYADLNWPVPGSAYSCQDRCSATVTSKCQFCKVYTKPNPPQCNTIWSDINPILAVPTQVKNLAPEWSTCSFWDLNIPNFWSDPPIALQAPSAMAAPMMGPVSASTTAAPISTAKSPFARSTANPGASPSEPKAGASRDHFSSSAAASSHSKGGSKMPSALSTAIPPMPSLHIPSQTSLPPIITDAPKAVVLAAHGLTITASYLPQSKGVAMKSTTAWMGQDPVSAYGARISLGSSGLVLIRATTTVQFQEVSVVSTGTNAAMASSHVSGTQSSRSSVSGMTSSAQASSGSSECCPSGILLQWWIVCLGVCAALVLR